MINKFLVFPCVTQSNGVDYSGPVVTLANESNMSIVLFFPISENNANIVNYILNNHPKEYSTNQDIIGIYKTMIDSWEISERFLSGISFDIEIDPKSSEENLSVKLIISDEDGAVDGILRVNFLHAIFLAAMERKEILVSDELLNKLMPLKNSDEDGENEDGENEDGDDESPQPPQTPIIPIEKKFPVDKDILDIAKKIMSGKIK